MFYEDGSEPEFSLTVGTSCHLVIVVITQCFIKLEKVLGGGLGLILRRLNLDLVCGLDDDGFGVEDSRLPDSLDHGCRTGREALLTTQWERLRRRTGDIGGLHWTGQCWLVVGGGHHSRPAGCLVATWWEVTGSGLHLRSDTVEAWARKWWRSGLRLGLGLRLSLRLRLRLRLTTSANLSLARKVKDTF